MGKTSPRKTHALGVASLVASLLLAGSSSGQSQRADATVGGALVYGAARDILALPGAGDLDLVPGGRVSGATEVKLPESVIHKLRIRTGEDRDAPQPFFVFGPEPLLQNLQQTPAPGVVFEPPPNLRPEQLPPSPCGPQCLPAEPGLPGSVPPRVVLPGATFPPARAVTPQPTIPGLSPGSAVSSPAATCAMAARRMRDLAQRQPGCFPGMGAEASQCTTPLPATAEYKAYQRACNAAAASFSDPNLSQLAVLTREGDSAPFCSALLITPTLALTAAHCFNEISVSRVRLHPWSEPDDAIAVGFERGGSAMSTGLEEGIAALRLQRAVSAAHNSVCFDNPRGTDELRLYGYMAALGETADPWQGHVQSGVFACSAISTSAIQLAPAIERGCYRHNCQAFGGFSGSPMFASRAPATCRTLVVGMHVGAVGQTGGLCTGAATNSAVSGSVLADAAAALMPETSSDNSHPSRSIP
jgi:hypothetical protein